MVLRDFTVWWHLLYAGDSLSSGRTAGVFPPFFILHPSFSVVSTCMAHNGAVQLSSILTHTHAMTVAVQRPLHTAVNDPVYCCRKPLGCKCRTPLSLHWSAMCTSIEFRPHCRSFSFIFHPSSFIFCLLNMYGSQWCCAAFLHSHPHACNDGSCAKASPHGRKRSCLLLSQTPWL